MDPSRYFDSRLISNTPGSIQSHTPDLYPLGMLSAQYTIACEPDVIFPLQDNWNPAPTDYRLIFHNILNPAARPCSGVPYILAYPSHEKHGTQTVRQDFIGKDKTTAVQEQVCAPRQPTRRNLVSQVPYKCVRHPPTPSTIEFIVDGESGARLSDVLEGNWTGFEGRDDRSLFGSDRSQIFLRVHLVGCSPWNSKINITDFTAGRRPITRARLATEVAKGLSKFIAREKLNGHDAGHPRCGWGDVSLRNVILTRITRVSVASWQPELFLEHPLVPSEATASSSSDPLD